MYNTTNKNKQIIEGQKNYTALYSTPRKKAAIIKQYKKFKLFFSFDYSIEMEQPNHRKGRDRLTALPKLLRRRQQHQSPLFQFDSNP